MLDMEDEIFTQTKERAELMEPYRVFSSGDHKITVDSICMTSHIMIWAETISKKLNIQRMRFSCSHDYVGVYIPAHEWIRVRVHTLPEGIWKAL